MSVTAAYVITFIASFCVLVIEICAGRILAPHVGVSLYTWTSIIGVVLAGISIGAYLGGRVADRFPYSRTLAWLLFISGIAVLLIAPVTNMVAAYKFPTTLMLRILIVTTITFFIPSCILGMISPVVIKLALSSMDRVGHTVGKIYAISTMGSIIGTFAAGFWLISWMGTRQIMLLMGGILVLTGIVYGTFFRSRKAVIGMAVVPAILIAVFYGVAFKPVLSEGTLLYKESDYFTLKISEVRSSDDETMLRALVLDNLTHSFTKMGDPLHIEYEYERIYDDVMRWRFGKDRPFSTLTIGGGGYTFPRYMEHTYPNSRNDVVEIDPDVTRLVYSHLGMPKETAIRTFNEDGRWYVMNCTEQYDVVFIDAYNDLSIPYHLTTKEFADQIKGILKPGGILLTNIIDNFQQGVFLSSYMKTLGEVFGKDNVHLISISPHFEGVRIATFIVMTGRDSIDIGSFSAYLEKNPRGGASSVVPEALVAKLFERPGSMTLTDNHVPVDNLIAPIFEARFGYNRKN